MKALRLISLMHSTQLVNPLRPSRRLNHKSFDTKNQPGEGYRRSQSEQAFKLVDEHLDERYSNPDERQKVTKELIVSYALYADGTKLPKDLSSQRKYLRSCFEKIEQKERLDAARRFVSGLGNLALYRRYYWERSGINELVRFCPSQQVAQLQLCVWFLRDMNTSLAIPPLARYWSKFEQDRNFDEFLIAVRALTAFIVLRRAATGTTAGIDSDLRAVMSRPAPRAKFPLCAGLEQEHMLLTLAEFKTVLRSYLATNNIGVVDEASWVKRVSVNPLAQQSKPLTRFLLLAAADQSQPDQEKPGLWTKEDVISTDEREYLTFTNWTAEKYSTVEHIAPKSKPKEGWDDSIYQQPYTKETLGNLVLLPQEENSSASNAGWYKKKLFYQALAECSHSQRKMYIKKANAAGFDFSKKIKEILD